MIDVKINTDKAEVEEDKYPYIGKNDGGVLVLFTSPKCGVCIKSKVYPIDNGGLLR